MKKRRRHPLINWVSSFVEAWEMLLDIPLPPNLSKMADEESPDPAKVLCAFAVVGAVSGIVFYLAAWFFSILSGKPAAAVIGSLLITIAYEFATGGRMISSVASLAENLFSPENREGVFLKIDDSIRKTHDIFGSIGMLSFFAVRMLSIGFIIFSGNISWLIIAMTAGFTMQSQLAQLPELETQEPFIETAHGKAAYLPWAVFAVVCFIFGILYLPAALTTGILVVLLACLAVKYIPETLGGVNGPMIGIAGYFTETAVLLLGLVFLFR